MRMPSGFSNAARIKVAAAGFCMQLALGAVYGWSVFLNPLQQHFGASKVATNLTFTITLAVLGITAGFGGALQRRIGPRATATLAGLFYGAGVLLSGLRAEPGRALSHLRAARRRRSRARLHRSARRSDRLVSRQARIHHRPRRRRGSGLALSSSSPLASMLIGAYGVRPTLVMLGVAYLAIVVAAAQFLRTAPENYAPPGWTPAASAAAQRGPGRSRSLAALRTPHWYLLWAMLALNVTAGAALISVAAPLVQELTLAGPALGTLAVCLISLFNGIGRLFWGALSDALGRAGTFLALFLSAGARLRAAAGCPALRGGAHSDRRHRALLRRRLRNHAGLRHRCVRRQECRNDLWCDADGLECRCRRRPAPDCRRAVSNRPAVDCRHAGSRRNPAGHLQHPRPAQRSGLCASAGVSPERIAIGR